MKMNFALKKHFALTFAMGASLTIGLGQSRPALAGGDHSGGGSAVFCTPGNRPGLGNGYYAADYILALRSNLPLSEGADDAIAVKLGQTVPELARSLDNFKTTYQNALKGRQQITQSVYWRESKDGLVRVEDEELKQLLPEGCKTLYQAVRRDDRPKQTVYFYSKPILDSWFPLATEQVFWILIHEWLRYYTGKAEIIREVNQYLHSKEFLSAGETEIVDALETLRLMRFETKSSENIAVERVDKIKKDAEEIEKLVRNTYVEKSIDMGSSKSLSLSEFSRMLAVLSKSAKTTGVEDRHGLTRYGRLHFLVKIYTASAYGMGLHLPTNPRYEEDKINDWIGTHIQEVLAFERQYRSDVDASRLFWSLKSYPGLNVGQ